MRGVVLPGNQQVEVREFAVPRPAAGQVLLRMQASGLCGGDLRALTGALSTDVSDASGTLLFDVRQRRGSDEVIQALDIDPHLLPPAVEGPERTGTITVQAATATGLKTGTAVVAGGSDNRQPRSG